MIGTKAKHRWVQAVITQQLIHYVPRRADGTLAPVSLCGVDVGQSWKLGEGAVWSGDLCRGCLRQLT